MTYPSCSGRSVLSRMGMSSGPSTEHGICVQTRQKEFELYFLNSMDATRWLQAFERALLTAKVTQDAEARSAVKILPPELNRAVTGSSGFENFDTASTAATSRIATPTEAFDETIQVIEATPEIPPAPAHSTQPCLATSLEAAEVTTTCRLAEHSSRRRRGRLRRRSRPLRRPRRTIPTKL